MFQLISIRDDVLLTCWPPAPDERDALNSNSERGIARWSLPLIASLGGSVDETVTTVYRQRKSLSAAKKLTTSHAVMIANSLLTADIDAPSSILARKASFTAVSGSAWMTG